MGEGVTIERALFLAPKVKFVKLHQTITNKEGNQEDKYSFKFSFKGIPSKFWTNNDAEKVFDLIAQN